MCRSILALLALAACAPSPFDSAPFAPAPVADAVRDALARDGRADVLVVLERPSATPRDVTDWKQEITSMKARVAACAGTSLRVRRTYDALPLWLADVDADDVAAIAACPGVRSIAENAAIATNLAESVPMIGADDAHTTYGVTGAGAAVAVLDTGIDYRNAAFGACASTADFGTAGCAVAFGQDFTDGDTDPDDCGTHGTNVSGIVAGVAPDVSIVSLKVFGGATCGGTFAQIAAAADWLLDDDDGDGVANHTAHNIVAANLSIGRSDGVTYSTVCDTEDLGGLSGALWAVHAAGVLVVASAGNDSDPDRVGYPACLTDVMAVAAVHDSGAPYDDVTSFSNGGPLVDIAAPGQAITAAGISMNGTSQAAPHVAGAAALLAEASPGSSPDQLRDALVASTVTVVDGRGATSWTYPRLFVPASLDVIGAGSPTLSVLGMSAWDNGVGGSIGDGDGVIELGERAALRFDVNNTGTAAASGVTLVVSSPSADLSVVTSSVSVGAIAAGSVVAAGDVLVDAQPGCLVDTTVPLTATLTDDAGGVWTGSASILVVCQLDDDGDGWFHREDCDDRDPDRFPGNPEVACDGLDQDCDGDDATDPDGDGFGCDVDCAQDDPTAYPGAYERPYDGVDQDCNGSDLVDVDGDGADASIVGGPDCNDSDPTVGPEGVEVPYDGVDQDCVDGDLVDIDGDGVAGGWGPDCDDSDPTVFPGAVEVPYDEVDQDCFDGDLVDADGDGFAGSAAGGPDCDDADAFVRPGAVEVPYDGVDQDCLDGDLVDVDGDGFVGSAAGGDDCDDVDPTVAPGAPEIPYDGIDQDCVDGDLDDVDRDGYRSAAVGGEDCEDGAADVHPRAVEVPNLTDDDCDGWTDEVSPGCDQGGTRPGALVALAFAALLLARRSR